MKVLFLIDHGRYSASGQQLAILARALAAQGFESRIGVLGREGPLVVQWREAGARVDVLHWTRLIDPQPLWHLRRIAQSFQPEFVVTWGRVALRCARLIAPKGRIVATRLAQQRKGKWASWDRRFLRGACRLVAAHATEMEDLKTVGVDPGQIIFIPPGVDSPGESLKPGLSGFQIPSSARPIMAVGPLVRDRGHRDAIWALDILKYLFDDLHLVIIGDGPERPRLEKFARDVQAANRVHFVGYQPDVRSWLRQAVAIWVLNQQRGGSQVALEAMSVARPVVATSTTALAEIVADSETGFLVPVGDKVALARQTRKLLDNSTLANALGAAGQRRATDSFSSAALARRWAELLAS